MRFRLSLFHLVFLVLLNARVILAQELTLVVAADMPNISDPSSGKYAELGTLVSETRQNSENVFFIFGGGSIGPSALSTFDQGSHVIDILNSIEPDVMGVTKREFSFYEDVLSQRAYEAAFPFVASNTKDLRIDKVIDGIVDSTIIRKKDISLGFISVVHERVKKEYLLNTISVEDPLSTISDMSLKLKQKGADIVLLHYSYPFNFIGSLLDNGVIDVAFISDSRLGDKYLDTAIKHPKIMSLKEPGLALVGKMSLSGVSQTLEITEYDLSKIRANEVIEKQVKSYESRLTRLLDAEIGFWKGNFDTTRIAVRTKENAFANFITDSMRAYTNADIALINGGSIRGDTHYRNHQKITRGTIAHELPFLSSLQLVNATGQQILDALEEGFSEVEYAKGGFPHTSGLSISTDFAKPPGQRVISVKIGKETLQKNKSYLLATTDFLANGGDGFTSLESAVKIVSPSSRTPLISELVTNAVMEKGSIETAIKGRIKNAGNSE